MIVSLPRLEGATAAVVPCPMEPCLCRRADDRLAAAWFPLRLRVVSLLWENFVEKALRKNPLRLLLRTWSDCDLNGSSSLFFLAVARREFLRLGGGSSWLLVSFDSTSRGDMMGKLTGDTRRTCFELDWCNLWYLLVSPSLRTNTG